MKLDINENNKIAEIQWTKKEYEIVIESLAMLITEEEIEPYRIKCATLLLKHYLPGWREVLKDEIIVRDRNDSKVREWKKKVLERDDYKCVNCVEIENLHVHHIVHWSDYYKGRVDVNNGITLCVKCHAKEHEGENVANLIGSRV